MNKIDINQSLIKKLKKGKNKIASFILATTILSGCEANKEICQPIQNTTVKSINAVSENLNSYVNEQRMLNYYTKQWGYDCQDIGNNFSKVKMDFNKNIYYCDSLDEFRKYVDKANPTYTDVREAIKNNTSITGKYEEWLLEGLNNLEMKLPDLDLVALYQNIKNISIVEITTEEMYEKIRTLGACFSPEEGKVYIDPTIVDSYVICHEILGHGISTVQILKDNKYIQYKTDMLVLYADFQAAEYNFKYIGFSLEEGKADLITDIATQTVSGGPYDMEAEHLRIFTETCGIPLTDYIKYGAAGLIKTMRKSDINNPIDYIVSVDTLLSSVRSHEFDLPNNSKMESNMKTFFKDYVDDKIKNGENLDEIKNKIKLILENTSYDWINAGELFVYDSVKMEDLKIEILREIDELNKTEKSNTKVLK